VVEIEKDLSKQISDSFMYSGIVHLVDKRNYYFYDTHDLNLNNVKTIIISSNVTIVQLKKDLEENLGINLCESFKDPQAFIQK